MLGYAIAVGGAALAWWLWPKKEEHPSSPDIQFDDIPNTGVEGLPGIGNVRVFNDKTARTALENLAGVYTFEPVVSPAIGVRAIYAVRAPSQPQKGFRAFDWIAQALADGFYVISNARAGSGPWDPTIGDNGIVAMHPAELTSPDVVNDWAIIAGPDADTVASFQKLASMSTDDLLKTLYAADAAG